MHIKRSKTFLKHYTKLSLKIQKKTDESLLVFFENPKNPILRNHALEGIYKGCRSIDVTGDFRI
jgi:mRNA-degrading endonuclease YafQ of YafQ-DinJ toxin-antitoxin module